MSIEITTKSRQELEQALGESGRELSTLTVLMHTLLAKRFGLHPTDWKCSDIITRHGRITAGDLAELTGLSSGAITTVIDRLETVGFVERERDPEDRRKVFVRSVTDRHTEIHLALAPFIGEFRKSIQSFTDDELEVVLRFQRQMLGVMAMQIQGLRED